MALSSFYTVPLTLFCTVAVSHFYTASLSRHTSVGKRQKNLTKRGQRRERSENVSGRELREIRKRDIRQRGLRLRESSIEALGRGSRVQRETSPRGRQPRARAPFFFAVFGP